MATTATSETKRSLSAGTLLGALEEQQLGKSSRNSSCGTKDRRLAASKQSSSALDEIIKKSSHGLPKQGLSVSSSSQESKGSRPSRDAKVIKSQEAKVDELLMKRFNKNVTKEKPTGGLTRTKSEGAVRNLAQDSSHRAMNRARKGSGSNLTSSTTRKNSNRRLMDLEEEDTSNVAWTQGSGRAIARSKSSEGMPMQRQRLNKSGSNRNLMKQLMMEDTSSGFSKSQSRRGLSPRPPSDEHEPIKRVSSGDKVLKKCPTSQESEALPVVRRSGRKVGRVSPVRLPGPEESLPGAVLVDSDASSSNEVPSTFEMEPHAITTWTCLCGAHMKEIMKFCGMCATPQNWTCNECQFELNVCSFRFCGGCAAPKPKPEVPPAALEEDEVATTTSSPTSLFELTAPTGI